MIHHYSKLVMVFARESKRDFHLLILRRKSLRRQTLEVSGEKKSFIKTKPKAKSPYVITCESM